MKTTIEVVINTYNVDGHFMNDYVIELKVYNSGLRLLTKIIDKLNKFVDPASPKIYIRIEDRIVS